MNHSINEWREAILAGWEKYGTGEPLDPRTVEHLAAKFSKPLMPQPIPLQFPMKWPWERHGCHQYNPLSFVHHTIFVPSSGGATAWWDGCCLVKALVKEGPKAIVKYDRRPHDQQTA